MEAGDLDPVRSWCRGWSRPHERIELISQAVGERERGCPGVSSFAQAMPGFRQGLLVPSCTHGSAMGPSHMLA